MNRYQPYQQPSPLQLALPQAQIARPDNSAILEHVQTVMNAAVRSEAAARTAARMAKAAASAFEEEAHVLRDSIDLLRSATTGLR